MTRAVRVLVVEDEPTAAEAHAAYVSRVPGFEVAGVVHRAADAARLLTDDRTIGLVLLDLHLPDGHGLGLLRSLRASGNLADVIAVTSARDAEVVRQAVALGVVLYLLKPFTYPTFRDKLAQYAAYRADQAGPGPEGQQLGQDEVDRMLGSLRSGSTARALPKGMSAETLREVRDVLRTAERALSATEVAEAVGASRVTVRRYLEHLAESDQADRAPRYGGAGRPEVEYRWRS